MMKLQFLIRYLSLTHKDAGFNYRFILLFVEQEKERLSESLLLEGKRYVVIYIRICLKISKI